MLASLRAPCCSAFFSSPLASRSPRAQVRVLREAWVQQPVDRPSFVQLTRKINAALSRDEEGAEVPAESPRGGGDEEKPLEG